MITKPEPDIVQPFIELQNADGGFPSALVQGNPTALNNTHVALLRMDELGMSDSPIVHRAFVYILRVQRDDGGWNEDASIAKYDPPPWASPGEPWARVYLSAQSAFWLAAGGYRSHPGFQRALDFLLKHQEESGRFQGFPHSTWIATSAFVMAGAQYSETARKGLEAMVTKPLRRDVVQIIYRF